MTKIFISVLFLILLILPVNRLFAGNIVITESSSMVKYAASELSRYIYILSGENYSISNSPDKIEINFILGKADDSNIKGFISDVEIPKNDGYILKKVSEKDFIIASDTDTGILYGVYGLLEEYYGVGFYLDGDQTYPAASIKLPNVSKSISPRESIRGFLPWTNFPQSATSWSFKDYTFIIDQMAKMRLNFLEIHNYNGFCGHNEMFHNFEVDGKISRTWMATSDTGHAWAGPGFSLKDYRFGTGDLFEDYAFGADAALHNKSLSNEEVSLKGISEFAKIIDYAHLRGVKIGLGIELDYIPPFYGLDFDNEKVVNARINQIINDYPNLDYILFYRTEIGGHESGDKWEKVFYKFYDRLKNEAPQIKMAVSGWGMDPKNVAELPKDIICAPIAPYSASFETGNVYGTREYWGCPWLERDFNSSVHYYPYNINLSDTIKSYQNSDSNMTGFMCLTWRNADAVDAKMSYISKAPWYEKNKYSSSKDLYTEYAKIRYGLENADDLIDIINENEAFASNASECEGTPELSGNDRSTDAQKALEQMKIVKKYMDASENPIYKSNLERLYERLYGVYTFCMIDQDFNKTEWSEMPQYFVEWARSFAKRVTDISSLGNLVSTQNRFINLRYIPREKFLREINNAPYNLKIYRNTKTSKIYFNYDNTDNLSGFNIYVNSRKINPSPFKDMNYTLDLKEKDIVSIQVTAVQKNGVEGGKSTPLTSGFKEDKENSRQIVISPPTSVLKGENAEITARYFAENIDPVFIKPVMYYKEIGTKEYKRVPMKNKTGNVFSCSMPINNTTEYYIMNNINDQKYSNTIVPFSIDNLPAKNLGPLKLQKEKESIVWNKSGNAYWYKIYRSKKSSFKPDYTSFVTYVPESVSSFTDMDKDFNGAKLSGKYYYKVTYVDEFGRESSSSNEISIKYDSLEEQKKDPYFLTSSNAVTTGCQLYTDFNEGLTGIGFFGETVGDSITFNKIPSAKGIAIKYSSITDTVCTIYIDGIKQPEKILFKNTGDWYTYDFVTINTPIKKSIALVSEEDDLEHNKTFICNIISAKLEK